MGKWWSSPTEILTLGLYQLENLAAQRVPFLLIDLAAAEPPTPNPLPQLAPQCVRLPAAEIVDFLRSRDSSPDLPIVLLCEDGKRSIKLAQKLAKDGDFTNLYVFEGGWAALLGGVV
jgi:rhodanese-related sulfurtransferase